METGRRQGNEMHILYDVGIIVLSILVAVLLVQTNTFADILASTKKTGILGALIAGMFFTSIFTTAPAIAALGQVALIQGILPTALIGAVGSMFGDLIIFRFVRDRFSEHITEVLLSKRSGRRRFHLLFRRRFFRWGTFFVGGLILASPLPDELGIALLGFSKMNPRYFSVLSYIFNFLGILAIGLAARSLAS